MVNSITVNAHGKYDHALSDAKKILKSILTFGLQNLNSSH